MYLTFCIEEAIDFYFLLIMFLYQGTTAASKIYTYFQTN